MNSFKGFKISWRTQALATPFPRNVTPKYDYNKIEVFGAVSKYALKAEPSLRTQTLAQSLIRNTQPKFKNIKVPKTTVSGCSLATLTAVCTDRLDHLSRLPPWKVVSQMKNFKGLNEKIDKYLINLLENSKSSMYVQMHWAEQIKQNQQKKTRMKRSQESFLQKKQEKQAQKMEKLLLWCEDRAKPKRTFSPSPLPPSKRKALEFLLERLRGLAQPKIITPKPGPPPDPRSVMSVTPSTLKFVATPRIKELAQPKPITNPRENKPGVKKGALTYQITELTKSLATPRPRAQALDNDLKENPYSVSPLALKARCSNRLKELAKPKSY